ETICLKALARSPEQRFRSAGEMAEELRRWLGGLPIRTRPLSVFGHLARWTRRNPGRAALGALTVVAVAVALGTLVVSNRQIAAAQRDVQQEAAEHLRNLVRMHVRRGNQMVVNGDHT